MSRVCRHTLANAPLEEDASNPRRRMVDDIRKSLGHNKCLNKNLLISIIDPIVELYVVYVNLIFFASRDRIQQHTKGALSRSLKLK